MIFPRFSIQGGFVNTISILLPVLTTVKILVEPQILSRILAQHQKSTTALIFLKVER